MGTAATIVCSAAGAVIVAATVRDAYGALFHSEGRAVIARTVTRALWLAFRRVKPSPRRLAGAGPLALALVLVTWALLLVLGWALVFWPHMPGGFRFDPGVRAAAPAFVHALNVSLVTLTTLGFGDITPQAEWLRLLLPVEALLGFGLLSASISWVLSIYPALSRRRSLAYEVWLLRVSERESGRSVYDITGDAAAGLLSELTSRLIAVERDLVHFPITYYFTSADLRFSLAASVPYLHQLAEVGMEDDQPALVRFRARLLRQTVDDLARTAADRFHRARADDTETLLDAYRADHLVTERGG